MEAYLFDPFTARFRGLRTGRGGALCGEVNAKNRMGAYVGFKDFVIGRDRSTVYLSSYNDGVESQMYGSFAEAYVNACATKAEENAYRLATNYYEPDYGDEGSYSPANSSYVPSATDNAAAAFSNAEAGAEPDVVDEEN